MENLYERPCKRKEKTGKFVFTPRYPGKNVLKKEEFGQEETIALVPYAAAKLRVTVFPVIPKETEDGHDE